MRANPAAFREEEKRERERQRERERKRERERERETEREQVAWHGEELESTRAFFRHSKGVWNQPALNTNWGNSRYLCLLEHHAFSGAAFRSGRLVLQWSGVALFCSWLETFAVEH